MAEEWRPLCTQADLSIRTRLREQDLGICRSQLLGSNKIDDAIAIFELNAQEYPQSSNAFDSLGDAYFRKGEWSLATESYQRSLELNPNNSNAIEQLKELQTKPQEP
jgi:D-alanyl-D-alanine-carboxypeptidase/D-alanyl-D-alanine-endopeptidase